MPRYSAAGVLLFAFLFTLGSSVIVVSALSQAGDGRRSAASSPRASLRGRRFIRS